MTPAEEGPSRRARSLTVDAEQCIHRVPPLPKLVLQDPEVCGRRLLLFQNLRQLREHFLIHSETAEQAGSRPNG